jgi:hypothetical protein
MNPMPSAGRLLLLVGSLAESAPSATPATATMLTPIRALSCAALSALSTGFSRNAPTPTNAM